MGVRAWFSSRDSSLAGEQGEAHRASPAPVVRGPWRRGRAFRRPASRGWQAAKAGRLFSDWRGTSTSINEELRGQLSALRARARELEQNSDLARRFLQLCETHVVGPQGFQLQVRGRLRDGSPDRRNARVESAFREWARRGVCEITGRLSFADVQRLLIRTCARDGELLVRMHEIQPTASNPFGFALEVLDPARIDTSYNASRDGREVRLGVELSRSGRPVAYWLLKARDVGYGTDRVRVPADEIIHAFLPEHPEQIRGVPWMAAAMPEIHMLDAYQEAAVTAARVGASKMGFFKTPDGEGHAVADDEDDGELITEAEPGTFGVLPKGYDFVGFEPDYPHAAYERFVKTLLHDIAAGLGVSYHALTGDLSEVNYSSARAGTLEERERWLTIQAWFREAVLRPIYLRWLSNALLHTDLAGRLTQDEAMARYGVHEWQGRRWQWVDPLKDIQASITAIAAGLKSPQQVMAESGVDPEETLEQIARFLEQAREREVPVSFAPSQTAQETSDA